MCLPASALYMHAVHSNYDQSPVALGLAEAYAVNDGGVV
jgi:hypothetical protein